MSGPRKFTHTVKHGETLASIAHRYRVSVADLKRWNKIGRLSAGQHLTIVTRHRAAPKRHAVKVKGKPRQATVSKSPRKSGT